MRNEDGKTGNKRYEVWMGLTSREKSLGKEHITLEGQKRVLLTLSDDVAEAFYETLLGIGNVLAGATDGLVRGGDNHVDGVDRIDRVDEDPEAVRMDALRGRFVMAVDAYRVDMAAVGSTDVSFARALTNAMENLHEQVLLLAEMLGVTYTPLDQTEPKLPLCLQPDKAFSNGAVQHECTFKLEGHCSTPARKCRWQRTWREGGDANQEIGVPGTIASKGKQHE